MGAVVGTTCYATQAEALRAHYGSIAVQSQATPGCGNVNYGCTTEVTYYFSGSGPTGWSRIASTFDNASNTIMGTSTSYAGDLPFPSCNPADKFLDGVTLGWAVASVLVAVAALKLMRRGI